MFTFNDKENVNDENFETTGRDEEKFFFPPKEKCRVLILGCGNSRFGEDMMKDGWSGDKIVNVDFSSIVIKQMNKKYNDSQYNKIMSAYHRRQNQNEDCETPSSIKKAKNKKMIFKFADITEGLSFPNGSFDLIICKGTLDSILCANGAYLKSQQMMNECNRLLDKKHGIMLIVSFGSPENRLWYFESEEKRLWKSIDVKKVAKRRLGNAAVDGANFSK